MPRLGRSQLLKKQHRWSGSTEPDRRRETPKEAEQRRQAAARRASWGSV